MFQQLNQIHALSTLRKYVLDMRVHLAETERHATYCNSAAAVYYQLPISFNQSISLIATLRPESQIANDMQLK